MPHAFVKIAAKVKIAGNPPGSLVQIEVDADGAPVLHYWRKRLADGDAVPHSIDSPASDSEKSPPKKKGA